MPQVRILAAFAALAVLALILAAWSLPLHHTDLLINSGSVRAWQAGESPYLENPYYDYPPSSLLLTAWMGPIPPATLTLVMTVLSISSIVLLVGLSLRLIGLDGWSVQGAAVAAIALLSFQAFDLIELGNVQPLVACLVATSLVLTADGRWAAAGLALGLSLAMKPTALPLVLLFLLWRYWRSVGIAIAIPAGLCFAALPTLKHPSEVFEVAIPRLREGFPELGENSVALASLLSDLGVTGVPALLFRALALALGVLLACRLAKDDRPLGVRLAEGAGVLTIGVMLFAPFAWGNHAVLAMPMAVAILHGQSSLRCPLGVLGVALLALPSRSLPWLEQWFEQPQSSSARLQTVALLFLLLVMAGAVMRRSDQLAHSSTVSQCNGRSLGEGGSSTSDVWKFPAPSNNSRPGISRIGD